MLIKLFIFLTICYVQGSDYVYRSSANGWLKFHRVAVTWEEAFLTCYHEGAVLASPLTRELLDEMRSLTEEPHLYGPYKYYPLPTEPGGPINYYIGTSAKFSTGQYVSIEGIPLENMPVSDMYQILDSESGECMVMDRNNIKLSPCTKRLPYICYRQYDSKRNMTVCGTFDKEYKLETVTGSCYKLHEELKSWRDANSICIAEGGYLAIINDAREATLIQNMIPKKVMLDSLEHGKWTPLFIGLYDVTTKDSWFSVKGEEIGQIYNDWAIGQPDNSGQHCGALIPSGKLDNAFCNTKSYFVCEKDPQNIRYEIEHESLDLAHPDYLN